MSGRRTTPVGTPVVIAPGKIPLIGEYAIVEEGFGVVAAITRHAKAHFVPNAKGMPRLIAEVVRRTQVRFGEVLTSLPAGSVLVHDAEFLVNGQRVGLGRNAATAVAAVGALLEALGLSMESRKSLIFNIADASRRATQQNVGSGADTLAATYGGLVQVSRIKGVISQVLPIDSPAAMHLVLFSAGPSIAPQRVLEGLERYARSSPADFTERSRVLRDLSRLFVDEVSANWATGAISTAGRYGDELANLSAAAQVPVVTRLFARASEMARELGGVAKPTGTGNGEIGVAIFPTLEAAQQFRKACSKFLTLLEGDCDRFGVRCHSPLEHSAPKTIEILPLPTPSPEPGPGDSLPAGEIVTLDRVLEEMDAATKTLPRLTAPPLRAPARRFPGRVLPTAMVAGALVLFAWFARQDAVRARFHLPLPQTGSVVRTSADTFVPTTSPIRVTTLPPAPAEPAEPQSPANPETPAGPPSPATLPLSQPAPPRRARKPGAFRPLHSSSRQHQSSARVREQEDSAKRAGRLSLDDF